MKYTFFLFLTLVLSSVYGQNEVFLSGIDSLAQEQWVDSQMDDMSIDQKIGQLFMIDVYSDKREDIEKVKSLIEQYHIGGLVFFQGTAERQAELTNLYQTYSEIPLLIGFDGEWGLDMRLDSTFKYPFNMTLGAIQNDLLIAEFGSQIGKHHKRIGIDMNFAPVVDINTNPKNPIIGNRSFGENKYNVSRKASAFVKGMQEQRVLANAKHFPGHGDTESDSHKSLPFVGFDKDRIESVELYPYKKLFVEGLSSVMVAHLNVPSLDSTPSIPSSLSYPIVTELLQDQMGFEGLIITDALNMKGASNYGDSSSVDLKAFQAGNDILLLSEDVARGVLAIRSAFDSGQITESRIDYSVRKILKAKYWAGLSEYRPVPLQDVQKDIRTPFDYVLLEKLFEEAITLVKNESSSLPIVNLQAKRRAYIHLGDASGKAFYKALNAYQDMPELNRFAEDFSQKIEQYDELIIGYHKADDKFWRSYKFSEEELDFLERISERKDVVLTVFTSPYALLDLSDLGDFESLVVAYQNDVVAQRVTAEKIFGASSFKGKLPVGISEEFPVGTGLKSPELGRLLYRLPGSVGVDPQKLSEIDTLLQSTIDESMTPGIVVLAARHGKIFYHKSFGSHSYKGEVPMENQTVFDLASLTKVLSGTAVLMRATEDGIIDLDDNLGSVFPVLKDSNKDSLILRQALSHSAGIKAWIPYYIETLDSVTRVPDSIHYSSSYSDEFNIEITDSLYLLSSYRDTIYKRIVDSELRQKTDYKYSGLLFYLLPDFTLSNYGQDMDEFTKSNFYDPIGASTLGYNPLESIDPSIIAPSEEDDYFRMGRVKGRVHDMGAAMMGGVSGNAGLFGSAIDVAKMMQMYLQSGVYGGRRYFDASTLDRFNKRYYLDIENRRGLGFDKPQLESDGDSEQRPVSALSFGHSGFTGTYAWADPENGLLYIFLSNRTYPDMSNSKLVKENIRTRVQDLFYEAIID